MGFIGTSTNDFLSLLKAIELDNEWHKTVTQATYAVAMTNRVPLLKSASGAAKWPLTGAAMQNPTAQPCVHCGAVVPNNTKHILNHCGSFEERYLWRKASVVNYIDSNLDHNRFKVFCDLPDRRTSTGGTIPSEVLPVAENGCGSAHSYLKPDFVVIDRQTNDLYMFVMSITDEAEMAEFQKLVLTDYHMLLGQMRALAGSDYNINFYTIEIGSFSGLLSESAKFALWEIYKLTTRNQAINYFIDNIVSLAKLGSFKIFKSRHEARWDRQTSYLFPATQIAKKKNMVRLYLIQIGKFLGLTVALAACILLLHIGYLLSGWFWANLTFKVMIVIYITIMGLFLSLFRP